jgi:DNA polymerase-3 subunit beta
LFLVATDGRRLARAGGQVLESKAADFQVIVPVKALRAFEKIFVPGKDRGSATVDVHVTPNQLLLRADDRLLSTTLVEGHFPKYEDVIPRDCDKLARLNRNDLLGAIRRAAVLTSEEARAVRLAFDKEQVVITAQSPEQGEARVELPIKYDGTPVEIAFNAGFVTEVLAVLAHDEVVMELKEGFRPGIVRGEDKAEFLYVIMPVSL